MKKTVKILAVIMCAVLLIGIGAGLTMALLTDTESAINTMTLGNVDITLHEKDSEGNDFVQDQLLLPAYWTEGNAPAEGQLCTNENAIDKVVTVENTGASEAYVRVVFAVEVGTCPDKVHLVVDETAWAWTRAAEGVEIDGGTYDILVATLKQPLQPATVTTASLKQVYLDVSATNEDVASFGNNYQIRVMAQAVQTKGFGTYAYTINWTDAATIAGTPLESAMIALDSGFGEVKADAHPWSNTSVWDGSTDETLTEDDIEKNVYYINNAEELADLAKQVNAGNTFSGKTVKLNADIDLMNNEWTPIGTSSNTFKGTFDGQGYTVSNLKISGYNSYVGLFGFTTDGTVKNLKLHNVNVSGRLGVGALAGSPYTSKYENITLTGNVKVEGMAYVGGLLGRNCYADVTNITINANSGSYVKADSVENGNAYRTYVGGVIGFMGEGGHKVSNVKSNLDVIGTVCDIGGITGIAHYGNIFEKVTCTGNVTQTSVAEGTEIGGIAGVWHNDANVYMNNCKFTGTLTIEGYTGDLSGQKLAGPAYGSSGNGKLIIDGKYPVAEGDDLLAALATNQDVAMTQDVKFDVPTLSNAYGATGINVINGQTIDGGGYTLDIKNAYGTWDSGISTTGGLIKNITVTGSFRGIFVNHNSTYSEKVVLENVTIDGTTYTISCDQGTGKGLDATGSTFKGWTSYADTIGNVTFTDCYFGEGNGYAFCRPYAPTVFTNCEFEADYTVDPLAKITFVNCTLNGVLITAENVAELVTNPANVTINNK